MGLILQLPSKIIHLFFSKVIYPCVRDVLISKLFSYLFKDLLAISVVLATARPYRVVIGTKFSTNWSLYNNTYVIDNRIRTWESKMVISLSIFWIFRNFSPSSEPLCKVISIFFDMLYRFIKKFYQALILKWSPFWVRGLRFSNSPFLPFLFSAIQFFVNFILDFFHPHLNFSLLLACFFILEKKTLCEHSKWNLIKQGTVSCYPKLFPKPHLDVIAIKC